MVWLIVLAAVAVPLAVFVAAAFIHSKVLIRKHPFTLFYEKRSTNEDYCVYEHFPEQLIRIVLAIEDSSFFSHKGISIRSIVRTAIYDIKHGRFDFGASTITQQLAKNLYFGFYPSIYRKLCEMFISFSLEKKFDKQTILELYLNSIYFDNGKYGITEAADYYFGVSPSDLNLNQCFILVSVLPIAGIYNPLVCPEQFYRWLHNNAKSLYRRGIISAEEMEIINAHSPLCLDEKICKADSHTERYTKHGPMINERYGPFPEISDEEKFIICTVCGEAYKANSAVHKSIANVIMNRIGVKEWSRYKTASDIIKHTGFDAYSFGSVHFKTAQEYFKLRDGSNKRIEKIANEIITVIRKQEADITNGCVIFYSPLRFRINCIRKKQYGVKVPNWNFDLIEKVHIRGCAGDFAFFRYIE